MDGMKKRTAEDFARLMEAATKEPLEGGKFSDAWDVKKDGIRHPGTRDVDVLFNDDRESIRNAVELFLASGFVLSAKHEFQLLKTLSVGGQRVRIQHRSDASCRGFYATGSVSGHHGSQRFGTWRRRRDSSSRSIRAALVGTRWFATLTDTGSR